MVEQVTTFGVQMMSSRLINQSSTTLARLNDQLATGKRSSDLTDYSTSETRRILSFRNSVTKHEGYVVAIDSVRPRLIAASTSLDEMSRLVDEAQRLLGAAQNFDQANTTAVGNQLKGILKQAEALLNERVGDRYIFAGTRYNQAPAPDFLSLPDPTGETYPVTSPALPAWDKERVDSGGTTTSNASAWATLSATIDDELSLDYGVRSTDAGIQSFVQGLRWAYQATLNSTNYTAYRNNALTELNSALTSIRNLEADVAQNVTTLDRTRDLHKKLISDFGENLQNITNVDINQVATKITFYQNQIQASYSVTGRLASLSILEFLR